MKKTLTHNICSVVNINYHIIFCPKYRKKILVGKIADRLKELLSFIAKEIDCVVDTIEVMPDHVHVFVKGNPSFPIQIIVQRLKGKSSRLLRLEFPSLRWRKSLWTRSYYCETIGCISEDVVRKYIENQKRK